MKTLRKWFLQLDLEVTEYRFFLFLFIWVVTCFIVMGFKLFPIEIVSVIFILLMLVFLCLRGVQEEMKEKEIRDA